MEGGREGGRGGEGYIQIEREYEGRQGERNILEFLAALLCVFWLGYVLGPCLHISGDGSRVLNWNLFSKSSEERREGEIEGLVQTDRQTN